LYAFARSTPVGVDIELHRDEQRRRARDHVGIARRMLGEQEAERLARLRPAERERELLRLWTRYEAELKRTGRGIGGGAARADARSWVAELDLGERAAAAVALERAPGALRLWSFA
jgi:phosphopantetheinyl transferase